MTQVSMKMEVEPVAKTLDALKDRKKVRPLMDSIGAALKQDALLNFRNERGPDGIPWEPLKSRDGKILRDTGRLRNSITYAVGLGETPSVEVGTNVIYARAHNLGRPEINLPARPFLGLADRQVNRVNKLLQAWADDILAGA